MFHEHTCILRNISNKVKDIRFQRQSSDRATNNSNITIATTTGYYNPWLLQPLVTIQPPVTIRWSLQPLVTTTTGCNNHRLLQARAPKRRDGKWNQNTAAGVKRKRKNPNGFRHSWHGPTHKPGRYAWSLNV